MGDIVRFHARASAGSGGYKSGRNSYRGMPDARSTASTRRGGTSSHWQTACAETPTCLPSAAGPPAALIARPNASCVLLMVSMSSTALLRSQALLHCGRKAMLYTVVMTLGNRIRAARERLVPEMTQDMLGGVFGITGKAVSQWELDTTAPHRNKLPKLARTLKVPLAWLSEGKGAPPQPDDLVVRLEALQDQDRDTVSDLVDALLAKRHRAA